MKGKEVIVTCFGYRLCAVQFAYTGGPRFMWILFKGNHFTQSLKIRLK